jgi:Ca2+-binding EF-hand superfamily protein
LYVLFYTGRGEEEGQEELVTRWRPEEGLQKLSQETKFTKEELQFIYRGFKQECPTGMMTEEEFRDIYTKFFPMGGT